MIVDLIFFPEQGMPKNKTQNKRNKSQDKRKLTMQRRVVIENFECAFLCLLLNGLASFLSFSYLAGGLEPKCDSESVTKGKM